MERNIRNNETDRMDDKDLNRTGIVGDESGISPVSTVNPGGEDGDEDYQDEEDDLDADDDVDTDDDVAAVSADVDEVETERDLDEDALDDEDLVLDEDDEDDDDDL